jgi:hypothetical protein
LGHIHDVFYDITPLLMSSLSSKGPNISGAIGVGHLRMVVRDTAHSPQAASSIRDVTLLFDMPGSVAEQALIDLCTVMHGVPTPATPQAVYVASIRAGLLAICEVIEAGIEHGPRNIRGCRGIVEDAWL